MHLSTQQKQDIFAKFGANKTATDTGSAESQIALFTERINYLTGHLKEFKKDHSTRLGLLKLVSKRKRLLKYLEKTEIMRYRKILVELNLRK
jgi:small subunit ribosomal protein S15